jgi:hypothetical protein
MNNLDEAKARRDPEVIAYMKDFMDAVSEGMDAPKGRDGKRISQSIGSRGHESSNHLAAIKRWVGIEAYNKEVRRIWKETPELAVKLNLEKPARAGE